MPRTHIAAIAAAVLIVCACAADNTQGKQPTDPSPAATDVSHAATPDTSLGVDPPPHNTPTSFPVGTTAPTTTEANSEHHSAATPTDDHPDKAQEEDPPAIQLGDGGVWRVVLVKDGDFLNVRRTAGANGQIIDRLLPGEAVEATGATQKVGSSVWREIGVRGGSGWVNGFYLTPAGDGGGFPAGTDPVAMTAELVERIQTRRDFTDLVSSRGLWVAHHAEPVRFKPDELAGILTSDVTYRWGSNALGPDSPEIRPRTFTEAIADRLAGAFDDPNRQVLINEKIEGPNGRPVEFVIPTELSGFPFVMVFDPGDDPRYEGLDWNSWVVSFAWEEGSLRVVGLTVDEWAP